MGAGLEFGILGPLEVRRGGTPVPVGGPRQRALLSLLLCHANQVVSRDQLIEELLADQPPQSGDRMLRVQVSRLRQALAAGGDEQPRVLGRPPGYVLRVEDGELDLQVFEQRVAAGRRALEQGDPGTAAVVLGEALALWRGRPLADLEFEPFARFEIQRLVELRLLAVEDQVEAELAVGHHDALCPELGLLVAEHPLRERLRGQLMLALYRSGRQAEALAVFHDTRRVLAAELGIDPGPALRQLHERVLAAEPGLDLPAPAGAAATRALPRDIASFTGREPELAQLLGVIDGQAGDGAVVGIHAIDGMAGVGKTVFAVHAAHRLTGAFPDWQFFLPLHGHTPGRHPVGPADALGSLLLAAGVAAAHIPPGAEARAARWRDAVAGKKILLLLDDAVGHEQVRPLLPGTPGSLVLVTSRRRLTALEDATAVSLDVLPPGEAVALLTRLAARPGLQAGDAAAGEITRLCGYLPLAIGMLASQLRHHPAWTASALAASLAAARDRLTVMRVENLSVAAAFDLSYRDLNPEQQPLFRHLGLHPGTDIDAYAAAALDGISHAEASRHLEELYDQHLITEPVAGRYLLHDLLREHARVLSAADDPAESAAAVSRLLDYYAHTAAAASEHIPGWSAVQDRPPPGRRPAVAPQLSTFAEAAAWLESERLNLHAAAGQAASRGMPGHAIAIACAMGEFLRAHGHWDQAIALHATALATARQAGDRHGQALAHRNLGIVAWIRSEYPPAAASLAEAAAIYRDLGDQLGEAYALDYLGVVQQLTGDYAAAAASCRQALALARSAGDRHAEAAALGHLGELQRQTGDYSAAAASMQQALDLFRRLGRHQGEADMLASLSVLQRRTGDYPAAAASLQQSLALSREIGHLAFQARALDALGVVQQLTGDYPVAAASHRQALQLYQDLGQRLGQARVLNNLGQLATRASATKEARDHHRQALAIARDIGVPIQEARALEGIGRSHLEDGSPSRAAPYLTEALTIYERMGVSSAQRVQEYLRRHGLATMIPGQHAQQTGG